MSYLIDYNKNLINKFLSDMKEKINISFEFFPSSNNILFENLLNISKKLSNFSPSFFSVTYGANSGEKLLTKKTVLSIKKNTKINTIPHLTCSGLSYNELQNIAYDYWNAGIKSIVALRGDYKDNIIKNNIYAINLVLLLKKIANFKIFVAAYPEVHPEAKSAKHDLIFLKNKIDLGASGIITQFFFNVEKFLIFRDRCFSFGIRKKIIPGILPILNIDQLKRFSSLTNVNIPKYIYRIYKNINIDDNITKNMLSCSIIIDMLKCLYQEGVRDFHFYTLNRLDIVYSLCSFLLNKYN
ncbi:methylenetetrahydrofolate reductase [Buchnera aphidicola]|uniref:methylenetetrahydrofolate reductase n=1 Tax=Buchnera aphidicola TaxID=9 RepID=UPI0031B81731